MWFFSAPPPPTGGTVRRPPRAAAEVEKALQLSAPSVDLLTLAAQAHWAALGAVRGTEGASFSGWCGWVRPDPPLFCGSSGPPTDGAPEWMDVGPTSEEEGGGSDKVWG